MLEKKEKVLFKTQISKTIFGLLQKKMVDISKQSLDEILDNQNIKGNERETLHHIIAASKVQN